MKMTNIALLVGLSIVALASPAVAAARNSSGTRHYEQGYVQRGYPADLYPGSSQYPDYSHTGSGYSREGCSASPAEC
jgi:hypothetical protein